jgi:hypothetical protein
VGACAAFFWGRETPLNNFWLLGGLGTILCLLVVEIESDLTDLSIEIRSVDIIDWNKTVPT